MTDIVERLRSVEFADVGPKYLMWEAANEIEKLLVENRDLHLELALLKTSVTSHKQGERRE